MGIAAILTQDAIMRRLCVFCGSSPGSSPLYAAAARELGQRLAAAGLALVFGGGSVGLMGILADAVLGAGGEAIGAIRSAFGASLIGADGALDRDRMRRLAFGDAAARKRLEAILHPLIRTESARRRDRAPGPYAILVVPLLVESGVDRSRFARVLVVDCPEAQQIERAMRRSRVSETEVRAILAAQATREQRLAQADDVIDNSGTPEALERQVSNLNEKYLTLAARSRTTS